MKYVAQIFTFFALCIANAHAADLSLGQYKSPEGNAFTLIMIPGQSDVFIKMAWPSDWAYRQGINPAVPFVGRRLIIAGGAEGWKPGEVNEKFNDLKANADLGAYADDVFGGLFVRKDNLIEAAAIVNAHLRAPLFDQRVLRRISDEMNGQQKSMSQEPWTPVRETEQWAILGDTSLRRDRSLLTATDIDGITIADIRRWHHDIFINNTAKIVLAGDLSVEAAGQAVDTLLHGLPEGTKTANAPSKVDFTPRMILIHRPDQQATRLELLGQLPPTRDGNAVDEMSDYILTSALGGGPDSMFYRAIRSELKAAYSFSASVFYYSQNLRVLSLNGEVDPTQLEKVKDTLLHVYGTFREQGPDGDLNARQQPFSAGISKSLEQPSTITNQVLSLLLDDKNPEIALHYDKELKTITPESLKSRLATAFPSKDAFIIIASSPDANALPGACVIKEPSEAVNCH